MEGQCVYMLTYPEFTDLPLNYVLELQSERKNRSSTQLLFIQLSELSLCFYTITLIQTHKCEFFSAKYTGQFKKRDICAKSRLLFTSANAFLSDQFRLVFESQSFIASVLGHVFKKALCSFFPNFQRKRSLFSLQHQVKG